MAGIGVILPVVLKIFFADTKICKILTWIIFIFFVIIILCLTLGKVSVDKIVSIYFETSGGWCEKHIYWFDKFEWKDAIINLVMMTPVGVFIWNNERSFWKNIVFALLLGASLGLLIESLQFILPIARTVQVQDVLFNGISSAIGAIFIHVVWCICGRVKEEKDD